MGTSTAIVTPPCGGCGAAVGGFCEAGGRGATLRAGGRLGVNRVLSQRQDHRRCENCEQHNRKNGLHHAPLNDNRTTSNGRSPLLVKQPCRRQAFEFTQRTGKAPVKRPHLHVSMKHFWDKTFTGSAKFRQAYRGGWIREVESYSPDVGGNRGTAVGSKFPCFGAGRASREAGNSREFANPNAGWGYVGDCEGS